MKNKTLPIIFPVAIFLLLSGCSLKNNNTIDSGKNIKPENAEKSDPELCFDCGQGGWKKMDYRCSQKISSKNDFKNCLKEFNWSSVNENTSLEEFKEGYLETGRPELLDVPTAKSIKVFNYRQWSVDENGQLYLLEQLG